MKPQVNCSLHSWQHILRNSEGIQDMSLERGRLYRIAVMYKHTWVMNRACCTCTYLFHCWQFCATWGSFSSRTYRHCVADEVHHLQGVTLVWIKPVYCWVTQELPKQSTDIKKRVTTVYDGCYSILCSALVLKSISQLIPPAFKFLLKICSKLVWYKSRWL